MKKEVTNMAYLSLKKKVLEGEMFTRIPVANKDIALENLKEIIIKGTPITMTKDAVRNLTKSIGISKQFIKIINEAYGSEKGESNKILKEIIKTLKAKKAMSLTLVYSSLLNKITNIYATGSKLIEDDQYFKSLESIIENTPGSYLRNLSVLPNGNMHAVIANPKLEFEFGGLADEVFTAGVTLDLETTKMSTSFFTERLVCTNGMKTTDKLCGMSVSVGSKVPNFLSSIIDADYHLSSISAFKSRIDKCYHTRASVREVLHTDRVVSAILGKTNYALLAGDMSSHRIIDTIGVDGMMNGGDHAFLRTDITLWDLTNEITAISSAIERNKMAVKESTNLSIQKLGGELMFSKPDLTPSNIKQYFK